MEVSIILKSSGTLGVNSAISNKNATEYHTNYYKVPASVGILITLADLYAQALGKPIKIQVRGEFRNLSSGSGPYRTLKVWHDVVGYSADHLNTLRVARGTKGGEYLLSPCYSLEYQFVPVDSE